MDAPVLSAWLPRDGVEQMVAEIDDPTVALEALKVKVAELMALAEKEKEHE